MYIGVQKASQMCLINQQLDLIYIIEVTLGQNNFPKLQIVNRIPITFQMLINGQNSYIKGQKRLKIINPTLALGHQLPKYLLSPMAFLNYLCKHTKYIKPIDLKQGNFMLSLYQSQQTKKLVVKQRMIDTNLFKFSQKIGMIAQIQTMKTSSIGKYNSKNQLNGVGINFSKNGSMLGIFKQDMLITQYNYQTNYCKMHTIVTKEIKRVISNEHMKSLNYNHDLIYFAQIFKTKQLFEKTVVKEHPKQNLINQKFIYFYSNNLFINIFFI